MVFHSKPRTVKEMFNGEHFTLTGMDLYRKTKDGYKLVDTARGFTGQDLDEDSTVTPVNPHDWYAENK